METKMIILEKFVENDFEKLISWVSSKEELVQFAGPIFEFPLSKEQLKNYISDQNVKAFKIIYENNHIGHAEINLSKGSIPLLCRILIGDKDYRGKGLGQKTVETLLSICKKELNSNKVELNVFDWNETAIKCYEKVGFKYNKEKQKKIIINGKIWLSVNMYKEI
jgi:RimJ/RimL family protein N-acetyltransferase